ncbi:hypothetical protein DEQ92_06305 [Haloferax sp. Atlit-6N]|uniref:hypothetical protein n=1 Tax=Haloferax sp. Atlit-6N TaxID=2077205 RepID=UPI000E2317B1|nr:hypothetical protein [Haloferax sp. Atlit-6N]REA05873.1 hypothetical protein DEQ92_06305 [Haloferax sp. Atlit-6N]
MREFARRTLALVFVVLVVTTAATGPVAAASTTVTVDYEHCGPTDLLEQTFSMLLGGDKEACLQGGVSYDDLENITSTDGYAAGLAVDDSVESFNTTLENRLQDTRTVAYSKAKIQVVNDINNGTAETLAKERANETVTAYYAQIERNIIRDWNAKMSELEYLNQTETGFAFHEPSDSDEYQIPGQYAENPDGFQTGVHQMNYTLVNGTNVTMKFWLQPHNVGGDGTGANAAVGVLPKTSLAPDLYAYSNELHGWSTGGDYYSASDGLAVQSPSTSNYTGVLYGADYTGLLEDLDTQQQQVQANMAQVVEGYYAQYAAGDIDSTDLARLDPSTIGAEASTEFNTTGYYSYAAVQLASIGYSGDLNSSHTIAVEGQNGTTIVNGTMFYTGEDAPAGWDTGSTYQFADYNGTFYFAYQNANDSGIYDLSEYGENFTIVEAFNVHTGEAVNTTSTQQYVYEDTNATALQSQLDQLLELREWFEQEAGTAGSTDGGRNPAGGLNTQVIGGALLVGAAAVLLIQREGNK